LSYPPQPYQARNPDWLIDFLREFPFASIVDASFLAPSKIPLVAEEVEKKWLLYGHLHPGHPLLKREVGGIVCVQFHGPEAYIPADIYQHQPAVSTWNYILVQATGIIHFRDDPERVVMKLKRLMGEEIDQDVSSIQKDYEEKLFAILKPFHIEVTEWNIQAKMSQDKPVLLRQRVADFLQTKGNESAYRWMKRLNPELI
jgi:transcriptional regulator